MKITNYKFFRTSNYFWKSTFSSSSAVAGNNYKKEETSIGGDFFHGLFISWWTDMEKPATNWI
jgi:hypothetical protein